MKKKTKTRLCFLLLILVPLCPTIGIAEVPQNSVFIQGVRPMSMGSAFAAVVDDENLLFFNPAGLQKIENSRLTLFGFIMNFNVNTVQAGNKLLSSYRKASGEKWSSLTEESIGELQEYNPLIRLSNPLPIQITYIRPHFAFSLLNSDLNAKLGFSHNGSESIVRLKERFDVLAMGSYGRRLIRGLSIGGTVKGIGRQRIDGKNVADLENETTILGITLSSDIGALYEIQNEIPKLPLTIGISAQNLIGTELMRSERKLKRFKKVKTLSKIQPKRTFIFGIAYQPDWKFLSPYFPEALIFAADIGGLSPILHLGVEMKAFKWLSLRAGVHAGLSMGVGLRTKRTFLDLMYATKLKEPFLEKPTANNFALSFMVRY